MDRNQDKEDREDRGQDDTLEVDAESGSMETCNCSNQEGSYDCSSYCVLSYHKARVQNLMDI